MDYTGYTAQDFLLNDDFKQWVFKPTAQTNIFWQNWLRNHPQQAGEIEKARQILLALDFKPVVLPANKVDSIWQNIQAQTQEAPVVPLVPKAEPVTTTWFTWYRVAAIFIGILLAGLGMWQIQRTHAPEVVVSTGYGEVRKITLPDKSVVVLNGNSTLGYARSWSGSGTRVVTLNGEAHFAVTHNHQPFRVQLAEKIQVEVLGTQFTVTGRPQKKQVVLTEGKVKVAVTEPGFAGLSTVIKTATTLKPGDLVLIGTGQRLQKTKVANPYLYGAFAQHRVVFKNTPLLEVARVLQDTYGYKVTFQEPHLATKRFTGSSEVNRIDMLLTAIEKSFNLTISKKGKNLTIAPN